MKKNNDTMIILTTHHLEEAELLSDKVSILSHGNIIFTGTINQLTNQHGKGYRITIDK